jgi:hypothetical protein
MSFLILINVLGQDGLELFPHRLLKLFANQSANMRENFRIGKPTL